MKFSAKKFLLLGFSFALFVGFQNFSRINADPLESAMPSLTKEDLLEKQVDLKLESAQFEAPDKYLAEKCFSTRVSCVGNRNHEKCLSDKVNLYSKCTKVKSSSLFGKNFSLHSNK